MGIRELYQMALESEGESNQEIEYTFFIKLTDEEFERVKEDAYSKEQQEQWEHHTARPDGKKVTIRVRSVDDKRYILCTKLNLPDEVGKREVELPTTKEMFEHFKILANTGTRKCRYNIKAEDGLVWEVDVYTKADGSRHTWCKVDLEIPHVDVKVPEFPFEFDRSEAVLTQPLSRTHSEIELIDKLFNEYNLSEYHTV